MERQKQRRGVTGVAYRREAAVGAWTNEREGSYFIAVHCVGERGPAQGGREGSDGSAQRGGRASVRLRDAEHSEGSNGRGWCVGDVERIFAHTSVARR
jgi:hypothetical protein